MNPFINPMKIALRTIEMKPRLSSLRTGPPLAFDPLRNAAQSSAPAIPLVVFLRNHAQNVPSFVDIGAQAGLTAEGQHHAVAIGDYDNDGDEDIYVGSKFAPNALYRNDGNMTFTEVGEAAGVADELVTNAAIWFDFDNDGDLDLATGNGFGGSSPAPNRFYVNQGDAFVDMAEAWG